MNKLQLAMIEALKSIGIEISEEQLSKIDFTKINEVKDELIEKGEKQVDGKFKTIRNKLYETLGYDKNSGESFDEFVSNLNDKLSSNSTLTDQIELLKKDKDGLKEADKLEFQQNNDKLQKTIDSLTSDLKSNQIKSELLPHFATAFNQKDQLDLFMMRNKVEYSEGGLKITDTDGKSYLDGSNQYMNPEQIVKSWIDKNPHSFKGNAGNGGTGSEGGQHNQDVKNPWKSGSINLTEQIRISKEDPTLAGSLKSQANKE